MREALNGDDLLRRINAVVTAWSQEQGCEIRHEGALVTIHQRPDVLCGYEVRIQYPFVMRAADLVNAP